MNNHLHTLLALLEHLLSCLPLLSMNAKERQAAEANKNASILLQELDQEKVCRQIIHCQNDVINNMVQTNSLLT